jgi:hypothetical protein
MDKGLKTAYKRLTQTGVIAMLLITAVTIVAIVFVIATPRKGF